MYSINRVQLLGNVTSDPNVYDKVTSFCLATNYSTIDKSGTKQDFADFHNCVAFGKLAEYVSTLKKGQKLFIEGRMQYNVYEKDGQKMKNAQVVIQTIQAIETQKNEAKKRGGDDFSDLPTTRHKAEEIDLDDFPF